MILSIENIKNNNITVNKIISLVPSLTELLFELNLDNKIVGITNFCKFPKKNVEKTTKIGGTKNIDINKIIKLNPDLIIASKEENDKEQINFLSDKFNVYLTDIVSFDDTINEINSIGKITGNYDKAKQISDKIISNFKSVNNLLKDKTVAYFIWNNPLMVAGNNTFINSIIKKIGGHNAFEFKHERYPQTSIEEVKKLNPDIIFLSSEPYKFTKKHKNIFTGLSKTKTILVEGEYFIWYGYRLIYSADYFLNNIKPQII